MSLSTGSDPIFPPLGLFTAWVAIVTDLLVVALHQSSTASFACQGRLEGCICGRFDARSQMPGSVCRSLPRLLGCLVFAVFFTPAIDFRECTHIAWISVCVISSRRTHSPPTVQVCCEYRSSINLRLEIHCRCPLPNYCSRC